MNQPEVHPPPGGEPVTIDCDRCVVRGPSACGDCVVTVLLGGPPEGVRLDPEEARAIETLASAGLVPPLRLVTALDAGVDPESGVDPGWATA